MNPNLKLLGKLFFNTGKIIVLLALFYVGAILLSAADTMFNIGGVFVIVFACWWIYVEIKKRLKPNLTTTKKRETE